MQDVIKSKNGKLKLILLPPKEPKEITHADRVRTLAQLVFYLFLS